MNAIVTGGAGFIGSNLALALEEQGARVLIIDDFSSGDFKNLSKFQGDLIAQDVNQVDWEKIEPPDVIFHQAALTDTTVLDQKKMMFNNVEGFRNVLQFAVHHHVRFIYASSAGVYGNEPPPQMEQGQLNPLNPYAYSKFIGDQIAERTRRKEKITIVGLRYFNVFGLGEQHKGKAASMIYQLAEQMRKGQQPRIFHDGKQTRDHIYIRDVVDANLKALEAKRSAVVNIATGKSISFNRIIEILNDVLKSHLAPDYFDNPYRFYQNHTQADTTQAQVLFGFKARYTVEEGVSEYLPALYQLKSTKTVSAKI